MQLKVHGKTAFDIETVCNNLRRIYLRMVGSTSDVSRLLRLVIFYPMAEMLPNYIFLKSSAPHF